MGRINKPVPTNQEFNEFDQSQRDQFFHDYYNGHFAHAGLKPKFRQKMKYKMGAAFGYVIAIVGILIVYGVINLVLIGGQELFHYNDKKELKEIHAQLEVQEGEILLYENKVRNGTISEAEYNDYEKKTNMYNQKVDEYNKLAEEIGGTFYVIPIPGSKH